MTLSKRSKIVFFATLTGAGLVSVSPNLLNTDDLLESLSSDEEGAGPSLDDTADTFAMGSLLNEDLLFSLSSDLRINFLLRD